MNLIGHFAHYLQEASGPSDDGCSATSQPNAASQDTTKATHPSAQPANEKLKQIYTSSLVEGVPRGRNPYLIHSNASARHRIHTNILTPPSSLAFGCFWMDESHPHQYNQTLDGKPHSQDSSQSNGQPSPTPKTEAISSPNSSNYCSLLLPIVGKNVALDCTNQPLTPLSSASDSNTLSELSTLYRTMFSNKIDRYSPSQSNNFYNPQHHLYIYLSHNSHQSSSDLYVNKKNKSNDNIGT